jgi:ABC-type polar amino acid transport system ATPase subunit
MVFQSFNLFPHMTAMQNICLSPTIVGKRDKAATRQLAITLLDRVGLGAKGHRYPAELSGGEQQRVAIARALAMEPDVLLFDEPTSALDPELVGDVLDVMTQLARDGMTMVIATHEIGFARNVADEVVFMAGGQVVESGPPKQVLSAPREERTQAFLRRLLEAHE